MQKGRLVKRLLVETLESFLEKNKIEEITINDILEASGVSRTTFYRYFKDKYDLINYIYVRKAEELHSRYNYFEDSYRMTYEMLTFFAEKKNIFKKIIAYTGQNSFTDFFINNWIKDDTDLLKACLKVDTLSREDEYLIYYNTLGWTMTVYKWIKEDCIEDPKKIMHILDDLAPQKMLHYYREAASSVSERKLINDKDSDIAASSEK